MTERKAELEKGIKRLLIRQHQEVFGKGPDEVWVKANRNLLTFYCGGVLTALEEFFLKNPGGEKEVKHIRRKIFKLVNAQIKAEVEELAKIEVVGITIDINTSLRCFYGVVLMKQSLDEKNRPVNDC